MPDIVIELRELHPAQMRVKQQAKRFNVLQCGRRWGKSSLGINMLAETALDGFPAGWFAPNYKFLDEVWIDTKRMLLPAIKRSDETKRRIDLLTGGVIEFWTMDSEDPGRSRAYKRVLIDEASLVRNLQNVWQGAIRPTLADYKGDAWMFATPKGRDYLHQCFVKGQSGDPDWMSWRMPTSSNPYIDPDEIEAARRDMPAAIFNQEFLGIPADDGGNPFGIPAIEACVGPMSTATATYFGVDLAKSHDYTVVIGLDDAGAVSVFERWQLDWGATTRKVLGLLRDQRALLDSTGVGDPIVENISRENRLAEGYLFTAKSKQQLMEGLASTIQRGQTRFPGGVIRDELECFQYEYKQAGGVRYSAPEGMFDDCVCALALACECRERRMRTRIDVRVHGQQQRQEIPRELIPNRRF